MLKLPQEFIDRLNGFRGADPEALLASLQNAPPVSLRLHPFKGKGLFNNMKEVSWCRNGRYLPSRPQFTLDPLFHAGCYYVQEAGSMLIEKILEEALTQKGPLIVLDLCAAPGGKSTHLADLLPEGSTLVSNETIPSRNIILRQNIAKWGYDNCIITQSEAKDIARAGPIFDLILVDAPCSGEGLFRKDHGAVDEWSAKQVEICAMRQKTILEDILPCLKEGGLLLYSTCTYEEAENDLQVKRLLAEQGMQPIITAPPQGIVKTEFGWQAYPDKVESEGFYCTLLRKEMNNHWPAANKQGNKSKREIGSTKLNSNWINEQEKFSIINNSGFLSAIPQFMNETLLKISSCSYVREAGIPMGELKRDQLIPSAGLALNLKVNRNLPSLELDFEEALNYLRCGTINPASGEDGWHLVFYQGHPLGWAKKIGKRWNNYFPKEWRIRMSTNPNETNT